MDQVKKLNKILLDFFFYFRFFYCISNVSSAEFRSRSLSKSPQTPKSTGPTSSTPSSAESLPRRRDEALARISPLQGISKLAALVVKNSSSSNSTKINRVKNIAAYRQNLSLNASPALLVPRFVLNETSSDDEDRSVEIPPSSQLRIMPQNDQNYLLDNDFQQITDVSFSEDTEKPVVNSPQIQHWSRSKSRSINESRRSSDSDHEDPPHLSSPTQTTMVLKKPFKSHSALKNNHNFLSSSQMSKTPSSSTITITKILKPSDSPTRSARSKSSSQNDESGLNQSSSPSTSQQPTKSRAITQRRNLDLSPVFNSSRSRSRSKNVESPSTPRNASHESKVSSKSSSLSPSSVSSAPANSSAMASSIYSAEMSLTQSISRAERESSDASVLDNTLLTKKRAELAAYDREIHLALFPPHSDLRRSERLRMKRVKKLQIVRSFIMESILNEEVRLGKKSRALKVNTKHVTFRKNRNPSGETSGVVRISASPSRVEKKKGKASAAKKIMMIKGNKGQRLFL